MIRKYLDRLFNRPQREQSAAAKVAALSDIGELERAISIVAAALPEVTRAPPSINNIHSREDLLRALTNGGSVIASCDWEFHPTYVVVADPQPNGRLLLSIRRCDSFYQEGSR